MSLSLSLFMQTFPECHSLFVFLTSPRLSLFAPKFLCTLRHQPPHFDAPVLPLFIFISPSSSSSSFRPSIHLFQLLRGRALRLFVHAPLPPPILCEGESYGVFERESAFHSPLYVITFPACVCGMYSLWRSLKFLRSVRRTTAAEGRGRGRGTRGRACDRTTSSASVHWFSLTFLPVTCHLTLCCHLKENKRCKVKRIHFSSPVCSLMLF